MKTVLLTILSFSIFSSIFAQRNIDLRVNLLSPVGGAQIQPMETFGLNIEVANLGSEPLLASDSLAIYLIMNGDTIPQMSGNYWIQTNMALASQQTHIISKMFAFDNSLLGAHIDFCVFARPYNAANPVADLALANNKSCAEIDVVEEVNGTDEINQELVVIYPNPVQNTLFISSEAIIDIAITDNTGKTIMKNPADLYQIDCSSLTSGIYFARIRTSKGQSVQKIIVER